MGKHAELKAVADAAEAALNAASMDEIDAALKVLTQADSALFAYEDKVHALRTEFDALNEANFVVDPAVCRENAAGVYQDGHSEKDLEFWDVMLSTAKYQVEVHTKQSAASANAASSFEP